jgi:nucleotide-binding universal stress UspA family protein
MLLRNLARAFKGLVKRWKRKNLIFGEIPGKNSFVKSKTDQINKMAPKLHRMLYATDLSDRSSNALHYAVDYANQHKAKLIVFHVINQRSITCAKILATFFNEGQEHKIRQEKVKAALGRMENLLEINCKKNPDENRPYIKNLEHLVVHYGRIAQEIVEKANRWGCELIILGPRRKRLLGRIFLPSVARSVIRQTDKQVYIINGAKGENQ